MAFLKISAVDFVDNESTTSCRPSEFYCDKPRWCRIGATMKTSRAPSKTDAVHQALLATLESVKAQTQLLERIQPILGDVEQLGSEDPRFDMKRYTDEMWGDG